MRVSINKVIKYNFVARNIDFYFLRLTLWLLTLHTKLRRSRKSRKMNGIRKSRSFVQCQCTCTKNENFNEFCCYLNLPAGASRAHVALECISSEHAFRNVRPRDLRYSSTLSIYLSPSYFIACTRVRAAASCFIPLSNRSPRVLLVRVSYVSRLYPGKPYFGLCCGHFNELIAIGTPSYSHESFLRYDRHARSPLCTYSSTKRPAD